MLINTVHAEWLKLRSTKSFYWTTALIVLFTVGWSLLMGFGNGFAWQQSVDDNDVADLATLGDPSDLFGISTAISGLQLFGTMIVIVQAVLTVTGEYGNGTAKLSALAAPRRWQLPVAKTVVYGLFSAVLFFVLGIASVYLTAFAAKMQLADDSVADGLSLSADGVWPAVLLMTLAAVLTVMIAVGVGYLLRRTAGAIALLLLWVLLLEDLLGAIPKVGEWISPWMPFKNLNAGLTQTPIGDAPWGYGGSVVYFLVVALVIFVAGTVALRRRDV